MKIEGGKYMPKAIHKTQTTVTIRMDNELKKQVKSLLDDFGMDLTTAFTIFAKTMVKERRFPIEIKAADDFNSEFNQSILMNSIQQLNQGNGTIKSMEELEDLANE